METLTIHPENNEQMKAIKAVLKALKIPFDQKESPYKHEFVKKINEAEKDREDAIILNSDEDVDNYFKNLKSDVQD
ncbi:MAG: hypothetical protein K9G67_16150 [Bacteroidales bacterium]|nr:hypothetical protein [Bacteroidales bacterium]MCF8352330.1 hypothetical protein [Bacteroidales bacterium]MCF8377889.1 hypothetical protein [Bacteroidales bacterium]